MNNNARRQRHVSPGPIDDRLFRLMVGSVTDHAVIGIYLEGRTGIYFDGKRPVRTNAQAYDVIARERLRTLSLRLANLSPGE
jgi:hypothetical protein